MGWDDSTTTEDGDVWTSITCRSTGEVERLFATEKSISDHMWRLFLDLR